MDTGFKRARRMKEIGTYLPGELRSFSGKTHLRSFGYIGGKNHWRHSRRLAIVSKIGPVSLREGGSTRYSEKAYIDNHKVLSDGRSCSWVKGPSQTPNKADPFRFRPDNYFGAFEISTLIWQFLWTNSPLESVVPSIT